jgi:hypothetical protein
VTETDRTTLRSRAWLAPGAWDCEQGARELTDRTLRFVTTSGHIRVDLDVAECSFAFPLGSARTGLRVRTPSAVFRFWFSNPYLGLCALGGFGRAQAVANEWRRALTT